MIKTDYDAEHNALVLELDGNIGAAQAGRSFSELEKLLPEGKTGFKLLIDLTAVDTLDPEVEGEMEKAMDFFNTHGIAEILRVLPDPDAKFGFDMISKSHFSKSVQIHTLKTRAEAQALLLGNGTGREGKSMYATQNDVAEKIRIQVAGILQVHLALAIDLTLQAKQAHWNVKGPSFIALHELFDKTAEEAEEHVDLLAERIVQFGGIAEGTIQATFKRTVLPVYPLTISTGHEHVEALSHSLAYFAESIREGISEVSKFEDADTVDILTQISRAVDKRLWLVEAHHQAQARGLDRAG